ncbi:MAG: hypothetical protein QOF76_4204, partial [Solirubrobacteraceae bacterium]|nr:hypothetical protein [Solirubrobacteraceae bacterium]
MRLAYIVLAHDAPDQLARLTRRLAVEDDRVFVHVDARVPRAPFDAAVGSLDGVRMLPSVASPWGGFGLVHAPLIGIRQALAEADPPDRLVLLSGRDYPIKPRAAIVERLREPVAFMEAFALPAPGFTDGGGMDRLERYYLRPSRRWSLPNRFVPFWPRRRLPAGLRPFAGKQFWCLPRDVAAAVCRDLDERPEIEAFFRHSFVADESFFQMLVLNGPHAARVVSDDLRFIRHATGEAHPRLLTAADFDEIAASSD